MAVNKLFYSYRSLPNLPELTPSPSPPPNNHPSSSILDVVHETEALFKQHNDTMTLHGIESEININAHKKEEPQSLMNKHHDDYKISPTKPAISKYHNISPISTLSTFQFKRNIYRIPKANLKDFWMKIFYFKGNKIYIQNSAKYQLLQFVPTNGITLNFRLTKSTKINTENFNINMNSKMCFHPAIDNDENHNRVRATMRSRKRTFATFNACDGMNQPVSNKKMKRNASSAISFDIGRNGAFRSNPFANSEVILLPIGIAVDSGQCYGNDGEIIDVIVAYIVNTKEYNHEYVQIKYDKDKMYKDDEWLIIMMTSCLLLCLLGIYWGSWICFEFFVFWMARE